MPRRELICLRFVYTGTLRSFWDETDWKASLSEMYPEPDKVTVFKDSCLTTHALPRWKKLVDQFHEYKTYVRNKSGGQDTIFEVYAAIYLTTENTCEFKLVDIDDIIDAVFLDPEERNVRLYVQTVYGAPSSGIDEAGGNEFFVESTNKVHVDRHEKSTICKNGRCSYSDAIHKCVRCDKWMCIHEGTLHFIGDCTTEKHWVRDEYPKTETENVNDGWTIDPFETARFEGMISILPTKTVPDECLVYVQTLGYMANKIRKTKNPAWYGGLNGLNQLTELLRQVVRTSRRCCRNTIIPGAALICGEGRLRVTNPHDTKLFESQKPGL